VKLENIFIAEDGRVRLGDFGLTMSMKQELAISPVGTVEYMAPEVQPFTSQPAVAACHMCHEKRLIQSIGPAWLDHKHEAIDGHLACGHSSMIALEEPPYTAWNTLLCVMHAMTASEQKTEMKAPCAQDIVEAALLLCCSASA